MEIEKVVDSLEAVPELLRGFYVEQGDGKYQLEDVTALRNSMTHAKRERDEARKRAKAVDRWEKLGKSPDEIEELLKAREEEDTKKAEAEGDHAKILKQHQDKWAKERADLEAELNAARTSERSAIISTSIMAALTKANVTEEGADLLPDRLASRIVFETKDGTRVVKILQADGESPMAGSGKEGAATFDDLVKEATSKWPSLFKGSGRTGSGTPTNGSGGAGSSDLSKLPPAARLTEARKRGLTQRT
jgi:DNA-binding transcriptional MerR regulator